MKKKTIIFYWLLLLIPTAAISGLMFRMLHHEQELRATQARSAIEDRLQTIAETLQLAVSSVQEELTDELGSIPQDNIENSLVAWQNANPLVRNVFMWSKDKGTLYPTEGPACTDDEHQFLARYQALLTGREPWNSPGSEGAATPPAQPQQQRSQQPPLQQQRPQKVLLQGEQGQQESERQYQTKQQFNNPRAADNEMLFRAADQVLRVNYGRQQLVKLARKGGNRWANAQPENESGWIPWFTGNRLSLLGWLRSGSSQSVYGLELEFVTLLSRLITAFPGTPPANGAFALLDGNGRVMHQEGSMEIEERTTPHAAVSLAPYLPHWRVAAFAGHGAFTDGTDSTFLLLSGLIIAIFVSAIILGGALLTRLAQQNMRDATQKTSFVSNVSHELKTPLTSIRMYAELLSEGRIKDTEKKNKYLAVIAAESQRLTRLVNNVLDFGRLEQGRKKYHMQEIELTHFLKQFIDFNRLRIEGQGMTISTRGDDNPITIRADHDAIEQALLNLVDNAIKYAQQGKSIEFAIAVTDKGASISVSDRGPGIPHRQRKRIFDKFHRLDSSLTSQNQGSGLGLSIARNLLRDIGGDLLFEPYDGGGSCFVIQLHTG